MANLAAPTGSPVAPISPAVSGPPGSPVSRQYPMPPPISPMVPPVSPRPPAGPVAAGGTRIMPGVTPGAPTSGPPGSQHGARGSAGVPPPPSVNDTVYTYGGGGSAAPPMPPPIPIRPGGPPGGPAGGKSRNNLAILAVVLGVLVVLLCGGGAIWYFTKASGGGGNGATTTPTPATTTGAPPPSAELVNVPCDQLRGRQAGTVARYLQQRGFKVVTQQVTGGIPNQVTNVSPCGDQPKGSTITLQVVKSALGPGNPGFPSNGQSPPSGDQSPGGPGGPSPSCSSTVPGTNLCFPG
jgi:hypothetical protein